MFPISSTWNFYRLELENKSTESFKYTCQPQFPKENSFGQREKRCGPGSFEQPEARRRLS